MAQPIWSTASGTIGTYPSAIQMSYQLSASAVLPATTVTYAVISGKLPTGVSMTLAGLVLGTPEVIRTAATYTFVVRATDNLQNIRDRTFTISISGAVSPKFTTPTGSVSTTYDSIWNEIPISYSNPVDNNPVTIRIIQGQLPPGFEINDSGLIRGYANPPLLNVNLGAINTSAVATDNNNITCLSTTGFLVGRPIVFSGTVFGGVAANQTYYVQSIIDAVTFTISTTVNGPVYTLSNAVGYMSIYLPDVTYGQPTIQTYSFSLKLDSLLGSDIQAYTITVINQNTPISLGGPGLPPNTRIPTLFNTRPETYLIEKNQQTYGYYVLPPNSAGYTYAPSSPAFIGTISSDNVFAFKMLGHDFDGNQLTYTFADLPLGLVGDPITGWITGTPIISDNNIGQFGFSVSAAKTANSNIATPFFTFSFKISNGIVGDITWVTPTDLGQVLNGTICVSSVNATCDIPLSYRITDGSLPPSLSLLDDGQISGVVAYQPTSALIEQGTSTDFTFTVEAYSPQFPVVQSSRTFTMTVYQEYTQPTDTLYIKCVPSIPDRELIASLLDSTTLIPTDYLYRTNDPYFGKASSVVYEHAYGINASNLDEYVAAVTKNHYWRNITLGNIKTAIARNEAGEIIYEVVYSEVIDNLTTTEQIERTYNYSTQSTLIDPQGQSISKEIYWPRPIPLNLGPWYTSEIDIYTSYVGDLGDGQPEYYTSLTPGYARLLYPNSLPNMRQQVGGVLGQQYNYRLLPNWMTSQQLDGSTLGYTPAWVIAYCKPGTTTLNGSTVSYAQYIQYQIQNNWKNPVGYVNTLNTINFRIDRFTVDKSITYNYDKNLNPPAWTGLPSATPTPDPLDSKDFYVLFPRETILPDKTQY